MLIEQSNVRRRYLREECGSILTDLVKSDSLEGRTLTTRQLSTMVTTIGSTIGGSLSENFDFQPSGVGFHKPDGIWMTDLEIVKLEKTSDRLHKIGRGVYFIGDKSQLPMTEIYPVGGSLMKLDGRQVTKGLLNRLYDLNDNEGLGNFVDKNDDFVQFRFLLDEDGEWISIDIVCENNYEDGNVFTVYVGKQHQVN